jgi:hypothetical protein
VPPAVTGEQVPFEHCMHVPLQGTLQQMPLTQLPLVHSELIEHEWPSAASPQLPFAWQLPLEQSLFCRHWTQLPLPSHCSLPMHEVPFGAFPGWQVPALHATVVHGGLVFVQSESMVQPTHLLLPPQLVPEATFVIVTFVPVQPLVTHGLVLGGKFVGSATIISVPFTHDAV